MKFISAIYQEKPQRLKEFSTPVNNEEGQAIVEYILLLLLVLSAFSFLNSELKKSVANYWLNLANRIVSPCASCSPDAQLKIDGFQAKSRN